jgi:NAD(P)-dependent dehydrogenase (short-subunit alcohol dehydrogenase family)
MSRIFISGSTTGLGLMACELLASQNHRVVLHARNAERAEEARRALPKAEAVIVGDVETIAGAKGYRIPGQCAQSPRCRDP